MKKAILALLALALMAPAVADNKWKNYHWGREDAQKFKLVLNNHLTEDYDQYLEEVIDDWEAANVLKLKSINQPDDAISRYACTPNEGQIIVCNYEYGFFGWVGLAGIWIDKHNHIIAGYTLMNDSYLNLPIYQELGWKQGVLCQELGHDFGLSHQDENHYNDPLFSCMDYQRELWPTPNQHDYDMLVEMYDHEDAYDSFTASGSGHDHGDDDDAVGSEIGVDSTVWGTSYGRNGDAEVFVREFPDGSKALTHILWAPF